MKFDRPRRRLSWRITTCAAVALLVTRAAFAATAPEAEFRVAAYGASGDGKTDDGPAIQRALDAAIATGRGAEVTFEAGRVYRLAPQPHGVAVLRIGRARGLKVSGQGATLIAHPSNRPLCIFDSDGVTVRDLTLDYDPLPFTQARLTEIRAAEGVVRFRVEPGYADPAVGGVDVYRDFKSSDAVFLDGGTRAFTHEWARLRSVQPVEGGLFEARFHATDIARRLQRLKPGDFIALKTQVREAPPLRDPDGRYLGTSSANIYTAYSRNVSFERITSHAAPGMTFVATATEGVVLAGCRVIRKPGTDRLIAGNSDGAHFKSLTVLPQVRDSVFEALMDDSINIKISSEVVEQVQGARVRLRHGDIVTDGIVIEPGQTLQFIGGGNKRYLGLARVAAVERLGYRQMWITLEAILEGLAVGDLAYLVPATDAVVERCEFRSQLKTALLVYPPARVSRCVFDDVAYGVHAPLPGTIEGPPPRGLRIADCEFIRPSVAAIALHLPTAASGPADRVACVAERCRITLGGNRGHVLSAYNQQGIHLRDVAVTVEDGRTRAHLIRLRDCTEVRETNVTFAARPRAAGAGPNDTRLNLAALSTPVLFGGDARTAYRDPAAFYHEGTFHLYFTYNTVDPDGLVWWQTAWSRSTDLAHWTTPVAITPKDRTKNFSSPGNIVRDGGDFVLCLQTYPTPTLQQRSQPGAPVPVQYGDRTARIWTTRSRDLEHWGPPELLRVLGPEVPDEKMGRLSAGFVLDLRSEPRIGKAVLFFHGSRWPEKDPRGGWATQVSLGLAWSDDLITWNWPGKR